MVESVMLIVDIYSLLPAFTMASFLAILLWPEDIAYATRLRLYIGVLLIWSVSSVLGLMGFGTSENPSPHMINLIVGLLGLIAAVATYLTRPARGNR